MENKWCILKSKVAEITICNLCLAMCLFPSPGGNVGDLGRVDRVSGRLQWYLIYPNLWRQEEEDNKEEEAMHTRGG